VFDQIVNVTEDYLGPAAHRFVSRQVASHLDKAPEEVTADDIPKLAEWTKVTLALLTEDRYVLSEYADRMAELMEAAA
jgi:hypothetical protein